MALRHAPIPRFRPVLHLEGDQDVAVLSDDDPAPRPAVRCRSGSPPRRPPRRACPSRRPNVELHEHPALPVGNRSFGIRDVGARRLAHLRLDRAVRPQERQLEIVAVPDARHHHCNSPVTLACRVDERRALVMRRSHESIRARASTRQVFGRVHLDGLQGIDQQGILGTSLCNQRLGRVHDRGDIVETPLRARVSTEA